MRGTDNYQNTEVGKPTNIGGWLCGYLVAGFGLVVVIPMDTARYKLQIGTSPQVYVGGAWTALPTTPQYTENGTFAQFIFNQSGISATYNGQTLLCNLGVTVTKK